MKTTKNESKRFFLYIFPAVGGFLAKWALLLILLLFKTQQGDTSDNNIFLSLGLLFVFFLPYVCTIILSTKLNIKKTFFSIILFAIASVFMLDLMNILELAISNQISAGIDTRGIFFLPFMNPFSYMLLNEPLLTIIVIIIVAVVAKIPGGLLSKHK